MGRAHRRGGEVRRVRESVLVAVAAGLFAAALCLSLLSLLVSS